MNTGLIFTDLDGTLLDHNDYRFDKAMPVIEELNHLAIPLILNSSKTMVEMLDFRRQIGNKHPFVVENGAAIFIPNAYFPDFHEPYTPHLMGKDRVNILAVIHKLRDQYNFKFQGFDDLSVSQLQELTGLTESQAEFAKQRIGTEPIKWMDNDEKLQQFKAELKTYDLRLVEGGRFYHVMGMTDKAKAMQWLIKKYQQLYHKELKIIALGDSENDKAMLEQADFAVVIRKYNGEHLQLKKKENVIYSEQPAPLGWRESVQQLINILKSGI